MALIHVIYHHFPHYRAPVMRALARSSRHTYRFFGSHDDIAGIKSFAGDNEIKVNRITMTHNGSGRISLQDYGIIFEGSPDAIIAIGNPNIRQTWRITLTARLRRIPVALWAHGWLRPEPRIKSLIRNAYFGIANKVLVYGSRAKKLAVASGFPNKKINVIWNSLNWEIQSEIYNELLEKPRDLLRDEMGIPREPTILLTISRVTATCRYEWLIDAVAKLRANGAAVEIWMIGDGPALPSLKEQATQLGVPLHARGAEYDERRIAQQIMAADIVVSPGKVGLTAMHALAYGTPVVTHGDLDRQMPEVEAITAGESGAFFDFGDVDGLARAICSVLDANTDYRIQRQLCRASLEGRFTPEDQARLIDDAIDEMLCG